jgi:hypothetical protein
MSSLDKRLNAYRPDLADIRLQGRCEAERFVEAASFLPRAFGVQLLSMPCN